MQKATTLLLSNPHPKRNRIRRTTRKRQPRPHRVRKLSLRRLQLIKPLQQPHHNITRLRQRKLLPDTNPRPSVEREEVPVRFPALETLRFELLGVRTPEVFAAVHHVHAVVHFAVRGDDDGALAIRPAASG